MHVVPRYFSPIDGDVRILKADYIGEGEDRVEPDLPYCKTPWKFGAIQKRPSESTQNLYPHSFFPCPISCCLLVVCE